MKKENQFVPNWVLLLVAVLALVAIADMPYDFYRLLRWLTFGVSIALGVEKFREREMGWLWSLGIIALIFNPLVPFDFERGIWRIFNICASVIFLSILFHGFFESKELVWKRIQAVFKPARLIGALAIILVLAGGWLFYSHQCKVEREKQELALLEENNKARYEKIRLEREKESRRISEESARRAEERARIALAQQQTREREEIEKQAEIKREAKEERLKKVSQVQARYYPKIEVSDCALTDDYDSKLNGVITNKLTTPVKDVVLKVSIFKKIPKKKHDENGVEIAKDSEDTIAHYKEDKIVVPKTFKTDQKTFFEIGLGYSHNSLDEYQVTVECEGATYVLSPEQIARYSNEEEESELITDPEELREIEKLFKKDDSPSQVPSQK
jgi:hypothetical protein